MCETSEMGLIWQLKVCIMASLMSPLILIATVWRRQELHSINSTLSYFICTPNHYRNYHSIENA